MHYSLKPIGRFSLAFWFRHSSIQFTFSASAFSMHSRTIGQVSVLRCSRCARMSALTFLIVSNGLLIPILYHKTAGITIHNSTFVSAQFSWVWLRKTQTVFCVRVVALCSGGCFVFGWWVCAYNLRNSLTVNELRGPAAVRPKSLVFNDLRRFTPRHKKTLL